MRQQKKRSVASSALMSALVFGLLWPCLTDIASAVQNQTAFWYGELDAETRIFRFLIEATKEGEEPWAATLTSFDEGEASFKLDDFLVKDEQFSFVLKASAAKYQGELNAEATQAKGIWSQRTAKLPLSFEKVAARPADLPKEVWQGEMVAGFQKLQLQLRVYADAEGKESVFFDSLSQKASGYKASMSKDGRKITVEVPSIRAKYSGELNEAGSEITGKWSQGIALDLVFKKATVVQPTKPKAAVRPQNPKEPYPYAVEAVKIKSSAEGVVLEGTLTKPNEGGPFPAAILISGSGPQDRDETLLEHKPFWVLADYLTRQGIAVLRYDERGVGKSTGEFSSATTQDFAVDVRAAVDFLQKHADIDPDRIGLIGHSEGGLIAPMVAVDDSKIDWIVLMAGPGVNGEKILYSQGRLVIAAEGGSESDMRRQLAIQKAVFKYIKDIEPGEDISPLVAKSVDMALSQLTADPAEKERTESETEKSEADFKNTVTELVRANLAAMNVAWFRFFAAHEPGPVLEKVTCPVLAINGERDVQVDPDLNLTEIARALTAAGNQDFQTLELPGLNHLFQACKTGGISEYQSIEQTIAPLALETIAAWIKSHSGAR